MRISEEMIQKMVKNWLKRAGLDENDLKKRILEKNESAVSDISKLLGISETEVKKSLGWFLKKKK